MLQICIRFILELTGKTARMDELDCEFSVYHCVVVCLLLSKAAPAQYEDDVTLRRRVVEVKTRFREQANVVESRR